MPVVETVTIEVRTDVGDSPAAFSQVQDGLEGIGEEAQGAKRQLEKMSDELDETSKASKDAAKQTKSLEKEAAKLAKQVEKNSAAQAELNRRARQGDIFDKLSSRFGNFSGTAAEALQQQQKLSGQLFETFDGVKVSVEAVSPQLGALVGIIEKLGQGFNRLSRGGVGGTAAIVGLGAAAVGGVAVFGLLANAVFGFVERTLEARRKAREAADDLDQTFRDLRKSGDQLLSDIPIAFQDLAVDIGNTNDALAKQVQLNASLKAAVQGLDRARDLQGDLDRITRQNDQLKIRLRQGAEELNQARALDAAIREAGISRSEFNKLGVARGSIREGTKVTLDALAAENQERAKIQERAKEILETGEGIFRTQDQINTALSDTDEKKGKILSKSQKEAKAAQDALRAERERVDLLTRQLNEQAKFFDSIEATQPILDKIGAGFTIPGFEVEEGDLSLLQAAIAGRQNQLQSILNLIRPKQELSEVDRELLETAALIAQALDEGNEARARELISIQQSRNKKREDDADEAKREAARLKRVAAARADRERDALEDKRLREQRVNDAASAVSQLAAIDFQAFADSKAGRKRAFLLNKATAIADAQVNAALAITRAFAELGPVLGPITAGIIATATAAQIATILRQQPNFHLGTRAGDLAPDETFATLTRRETVLTPQGVGALGIADANAGVPQRSGSDATFLALDHRVFDVSVDRSLRRLGIRKEDRAPRGQRVIVR